MSDNIMGSVTPVLPSPPRLLDRCPVCRGGHLYTVFAGEERRFLCRSCHRCWSAGAGWVRRVDPITCAGCEWLPACSSRWDRRAS